MGIEEGDLVWLEIPATQASDELKVRCPSTCPRTWEGWETDSIRISTPPSFHGGSSTAITLAVITPSQHLYSATTFQVVSFALFLPMPGARKFDFSRSGKGGGIVQMPHGCPTNVQPNGCGFTAYYKVNDLEKVRSISKIQTRQLSDS